MKMFLEFFYRLRENGLDVSINEWLSLLEGLEKGLHGQSLTGFYLLSRALLVKSEAEFDRYDQIFLEVFGDAMKGEAVPEAILQFLRSPEKDLHRDYMDELRRALSKDPHRTKMEDLLKRMEEVLREQKEEHNGGKKWVGTQGRTGYGNSGWFPAGIRIEGKGMHQSAVAVASGRRFRDFRTDRVLDFRQYQTAFRRLRNFSTIDSETKKEPDIEGTIEDTCRNGGLLRIRMKNPRKNTVKLLLLMDSGGSMEPHSRLCNSLFQAATKTNYFKELHTYYFHNCIFHSLYTTPACDFESAVSTEGFLQNYNSGYKVIIVGDAALEPDELHGRLYNWETGSYDSYTGYEWLLQLKKRFPHMIWLNPEQLPSYDSYLTHTHLEIARLISMFHLSVDGLEKGIQQLMKTNV